MKNNSIYPAALLLLLACTCTLSAQEATEFGTLKRSYRFEEADKDMEYALYVPRSYREDQPSPMIVVLHGLGSNPLHILGYPGMKRLAEEHGYLLVAPMGYNSRGWYGNRGPGLFRRNKNDPKNLGELSEKDVMNVLKIVQEKYSIDEERVYLMGHSMGGGGTWHLGIKYAEIWAGLAPIAPAIYRNPNDMSKIQHIPVIVVQGDRDRLVPVHGTRLWVNKMKDLKMTYEYIEVENGDHRRVAWENLPKIFAFFNKHNKRVRPAASSDEKVEQTEVEATEDVAATPVP